MSVHSLFKFAAIEEAWLFIYHDGDRVLPPKDLTMIHLHVRVTLPAGVHMDITTSTALASAGLKVLARTQKPGQERWIVLPVWNANREPVALPKNVVLGLVSS